MGLLIFFVLKLGASLSIVQGITYPNDAVANNDGHQLNNLEESMTDPTVNADYFEGDIYGIIDPELLPRNALVDEQLKWPNGIVPYEISNQFRGGQRNQILKAIKHFETVTCVKFKQRNGEKDYVNFVKDKGCYSTVGRRGGKQDISLGNECIAFGIILHEMMHSLGFWHEQSRTDRDDYVKVLWNNIKSDMAKNFQKYSVSQITSLGMPYDVKSILHYGPRAFAKNSFVNTLEPKNPRDRRYMGQRRAFSITDLDKINAYYDCSNKKAAAIDNNAISDQSEVTVKTEIQQSGQLPSLLTAFQKFLKGILQNSDIQNEVDSDNGLI
ncbi:Meprin A subunit beta [Chamberlinius hualienensis]